MEALESKEFEFRSERNHIGCVVVQGHGGLVGLSTTRWGCSCRAEYYNGDASVTLHMCPCL